MLGLRRVSFHIDFIGFGLRMRASVERWCERSTGVDMTDDDGSRDIAAEEERRDGLVNTESEPSVEMSA